MARQTANSKVLKRAARTASRVGSVAVVGLGRVGLPLALFLADRGVTVHGVDLDAASVSGLWRRKMPFKEKGALTVLRRVLGKTFFPADSYDSVPGVRYIILTLGTPVDEHLNPVFDQLDDAISRLLPHLRKGQVIILRSTVSPGTTEHVARFISARTRLKSGRDVFVVFCPERIAEGVSLEELPVIPQIVGAEQPQARRLAERLFKVITPTVLHTDCLSAELAKLFCNMHRYIDFAIANEFMVLAHRHGRDIHHLVRLVNQDYPRKGLKRPGLSGGPCLYKDGLFLLGHSPFTELISVAWRVNESVPAHLVDEIKKLTPLDGKRVALLGLGFKRDIDDTRNSLSFKARKVFRAAGADVVLSDPFVKSTPMKEALKDADVVFLAMNHTAYRKLHLPELRKLVRPNAVICDIWNLLGTDQTVFRIGSAKKQQ